MPLKDAVKYLGKRTENCFDVVFNYMNDPETKGSTKMKVAIEALGFDLKYRTMFLKELEQASRIRIAEEKHKKDMGKVAPEEDDDSAEIAPVLSMVSPSKK